VAAVVVLRAGVDIDEVALDRHAAGRWPDTSFLARTWLSKCCRETRQERF
jgi:hypothetical protein